MRAVLDTNVVASALLWGGTPERLIELAGERTLELVTSEALIAELAGILGRSKFAEKLREKNLTAAEVVGELSRALRTHRACTDVRDARLTSFPGTRRGCAAIRKPCSTEHHRIAA